jgi:hypothetical protein
MKFYIILFCLLSMAIMDGEDFKPYKLWAIFPSKSSLNSPNDFIYQFSLKNILLGQNDIQVYQVMNESENVKYFNF